MTIIKKRWSSHKDKDVYLIRIQNSNGAYVELTNYGASIVSVNVPDRYGVVKNVVLEYNRLKGYVEDMCYIGPTIGRFANRISSARFTLDDQVYTLEKNDGNNSNHGGYSGFNKQVFGMHEGKDSVIFSLLSPDGEGGFPGNLSIKVEYLWTCQNELIIRYWAVTDQKTVINLTNHAYFNLSSESKQIFDHHLSIDSKKILEADEQYVPTGKIIPAGNNKFFGQKIRKCTHHENEKILGLNHYYVFENKRMSKDANCTLEDKISGRQMEVRTSYPGVMLYTGDHLQSARGDLDKNRHIPFQGVCLECHYYPDSPNHSHFPSTVLNVGQHYEEFISFKFAVKQSSL